MVKEVRRRELERFLEQQGWQLLRTRGGHRVWRSPDGADSLAVPAHGRVSPGVVRQVIKQLPDAPAQWR
jgi:predicted RNA binding protein YcfA (HicA-like mRNA interferase family)